jgi:glucose/arabinose dehydrogenase
MTFYTGESIPEWRNNLFIWALRGMHIIRLIMDGATNRIVGEEQLLSGENQRFRHVTQGSDEALYAITQQSRMYRELVVRFQDPLSH